MKKKRKSAADIVKAATLPKGEEGTEHVVDKNGFSLNVQSFDRIKTAAEAMKKAGLDPVFWEATKVVANSWEVAVKVKTDDGEEVVTKPLWQVKVTGSRRIDEATEEAADALAERIFKGGLKLSPVKYKTPKADPSTLIIGLVDMHFGKLCWGPETHNNYDLKIAEQLWERAIDAAIGRCDGHDIREIVLPVGNDFGHTDNRQGETETGTPQDVDGRYEKVSDVQEVALIKAVERCRKRAPVKVIHVPGNHDRVTSRWLCRCVSHAFKKVKSVTVDTSPCRVKYHQTGKCIWGFAHGDGPKAKALKELMPIERPHDWAKSSACREWITGHLHQQYSTHHIGTQEQAGQVFRILPSLCGTDAWHYANGFSMSRKATQNLLYSHEHGLTAIFHEPVSRLV